MKITKSKLKEIIKESMQDEYEERLREMFIGGEPEQAFELAKSMGMEDFLVGVELKGVDLEGTNLSGINLRGTNLIQASLENTNLEGSN